MGTQGTGRKRNPNKEKSTAEDDALNLIAREAEARLAAKRAARAEAREIRMKELERQQKEIFQVQKKYYGLDPVSDDKADVKYGDIERWMEDSERYSRPTRIHTISDDDERMSVGSRSSVRSDLDAIGAYSGGDSLSHKKPKKKKKHKHKDRDDNGYDDGFSAISSRQSSRLSDESKVSRSSRLDLSSSRLSDDSRVSRSSRLDLQPTSYASSDLYGLNGLASSRQQGSAYNGHQSSLYEDSLYSGSRRITGSSSRPLEYSSYRGSSSRTSSRASSARASPVDDGVGSVASYLRNSGSSLRRDLDDVTIPDFSNVEDRDYIEKGSRAASALTTATLTSLGGTSSRRGSGETAITVDAETSIREIKEIHELKDQIQDVETKYMQNIKEAKDSLAAVEEKYRKAMVSNAQLDNEKNNLMYQVDTLKDSLMELEEQLTESRREYEDKSKDFEREKHAHSVLQFQFNEMKETLKQSEELLNDIRQLRMKQDGFVREISDLQETVEWKDKKIGALERQKEYTDAIRIERDELRDEVVTLKDVLKKHGIVLGPDLNLNREVVEAGTGDSTSGEPTSRLTQDSQTSPTEGNSMLGREQENLMGSSGDEEMDPEQHQQTLEGAKESHSSSSPTPCSFAGVSSAETSRGEQADLPTVGESCSLSVDCDTVVKNIAPCSSEVQITVTGPEENGPGGRQNGTEVERGNLGDSNGRKAAIVSKSRDDIAYMSPNEEVEVCGSETTVGKSEVDIREMLLSEQGNRPEDIETSELSVSSKVSCAQLPVLIMIKCRLADDKAPVASQHENNGDAENENVEELSSGAIPNKSQPQVANATGKKKKKKKKGKKKKGGNQEDEKRSDEGKENNTTEAVKTAAEEDMELARRGPAVETEVASSPVENVRESRADRAKDEHEKNRQNILGTERAAPSTESNLCTTGPVRTSSDDHNAESTSNVDGSKDGTESNVEVASDKSEPTVTSECLDDKLGGPSNTGSPGSEFPLESPRPTDMSSCNVEDTVIKGTVEHTLEGTTAVIHEEEPRVETEEKYSCSVATVDHGSNNSELGSEGTGEEELNRGLKEPERKLQRDNTLVTTDTENGYNASLEKSFNTPVDENCFSDIVIKSELWSDVSSFPVESQALNTPEGVDQKDSSKTASLEMETNYTTGISQICPVSSCPAVKSQALNTQESVDTKDSSSAEVSLDMEQSDTTGILQTPDSATEVSGASYVTEEDHGDAGSATAEGGEYLSSVDGLEGNTSPCPVEKEQHESSNDKLEDNGTSHRDSDEEYEEGQSFDFDEMDLEAAMVDASNPHQDEAEDVVESMSKDVEGGNLELCQCHVIESNEDMETHLTQEEPVESNDEMASMTDTLDEGLGSMSQEDQNPMDKEEATAIKEGGTEECNEEEKDTVDAASEVDTLDINIGSGFQGQDKEEATVTKGNGQIEEQVITVEKETTDEPILEAGDRGTVGEPGVVGSEGAEFVLSSGEEAKEAVETGTQARGRLASQNKRDQAGGKTEPSRKDSSKNSKKGKGKGKEECKMS